LAGFPEAKTGIVGWGSYIPKYRLKMQEISSLWGFPPKTGENLGMIEKSVDNVDEDALTMGYEAAKNAILRAKVDPREIKAVFFGTESKPYAVKPSATIIAQALGISPETMASDLEFACRAGSEGFKASIGMVGSGLMRYAMAIGSDTAQANPGDILEFTASSGAAAFIIGPAEEAAAVIEATYSYVTDTPDFWRRQLSPYPLHGEGFTGDPAYFGHIIGAVKGLFEKTGLGPKDFDYAVFHQPNGRFPLKVGAKLGFPEEKVRPGLLTPLIGNTYNGSALNGLSHLLDIVDPGTRILMAPFGSGSGSDAYSILVTEKVAEKRDLAPKVMDYIRNKLNITYAQYAKNRGIIYRING
jgi:hydroxymethylglutaryl-CoA synthase